MKNGIIINHAEPHDRVLRPLIRDFETFTDQCIRVWRDGGENYQRGHDDIEEYESSIDSAYRGYTIMDADTQLPEILQYLKGEDVKMEKKKPTKKRQGTIIDCRGGPNLVNAVKSIAAIGGYGVFGGGSFHPDVEGFLFWWDSEKDTHYYVTGRPGSGDGVDYFKTQRRGAIVINASTNLIDIAEMLTGKREINPEILISQKLLEFIKKHPQDEMVVGFIRRDMGLVLPPEVQNQGYESIMKWMVSSIKVPEQEQKRSVTFRTTLRAKVRGSESFSREDLITMEGEVPPDVIESAIKEKKSALISNWLWANRNALEEVDRKEGKPRKGEPDLSLPDFIDIEDFSSIDEQFQKLLKEQTKK